MDKINLKKSEPINLTKNEPEVPKLTRSNRPKQRRSKKRNDSYDDSDDYYYGSYIAGDYIDAIVYFIAGMIIVFPLFAFFTLAAPGVIFFLIGIGFLWLLATSGLRSAFNMLIFCLIIIGLGFISLACYKALLS